MAWQHQTLAALTRARAQIESAQLTAQAIDTSNITSASDLQQAIDEAGETAELNITGAFELTTTISIPASKNVTIAATDVAVSAGSALAAKPMFTAAEGSTLALGEGLTLTGNSAQFVDCRTTLKSISWKTSSQTAAGAGQHTT